MSIKLMQGDCLERMKEIPSGSVDMILADPPYGTTQCKWDSVIDLSDMWRELERVCKPNAAIVMTAAQPFSSILGASNVRDLRYSWVWEKSAATGHLNAKRMPMKNHEDVLVFYKKQPTYNPQGIQAFGKVTRRGAMVGAMERVGWKIYRNSRTTQEQFRGLQAKARRFIALKSLYLLWST